jgi:hypothetical protein
MDFLDTEEKRQRRLVHLPMGRFGEAVELANAALYREYESAVRFFPDNQYPRLVASDESSYVTVRSVSTICHSKIFLSPFVGNRLQGRWWTFFSIRHCSRRARTSPPNKFGYSSVIPCYIVQVLERKLRLKQVVL